MPLTSRQRAELRAEAHHLAAIVHVGQQGLSPALIASLEDALRSRELVKVQLGRQTGLTTRDAARALAERTGADVVQVIGRTATFYRENPELRKEGVEKPWRN